MSLRTHILGGVGALALIAAATTAMADEWPDLPVGVKNGVAERIGDKLIVGLGSAGAQVFALDLNDTAAGWQALADFNGPAPSQPATAVSDGALYVFSGSGKATEDAASPIIFDTVSRYDLEANAWETLDTTTPVGLLGASAVTLADGRIAILGGYNKELFDTYLSEVLAIDKDTDPDGWNAVVDAYMGMEPKDYRWNDQVLVYDAAGNAWGDLGSVPTLPNTGSAVVQTEPGTFLVINGEIKPGLRTDEVKSVTIGAESAEWSEAAPVPAPEGSDVQEGLAGAYAGMSNGDVIVAGGANFQGARAAADAGNWYAHNGLSKHWALEIFAMQDGQWAQIGQLPDGLAYGGSFTVDDGLLVVGGEDKEKAARTDVFLVKWDGETVSIVD
ncbi:N-acetylneuraminate epimerase [Litoreibacter arenae]|uniref:Sialic acid-induced transmembrane protein YjhT(NanM), possible mutarotase n=1 Tax=Litoreibacter arenae DSM 19593 TaxID=1123360 RepID=S9QF91_9RHOB|nr:N-acetylneuraminate epimerase [Litoreibacter arenae]EPX78263.1 Sialic acid-induced transmembrane protein YjhT(NanM), possible mutarotase [Litoreibacter arenae DSM 19593]